MEWLAVLGVFWFMGHGAIIAAIILALFGAALFHPDRIRNHGQFRLASLCLGASLVLSAIIPIVTFMVLTEGRSGGRDAFYVALYFYPVPAVFTMLSLLLGLDSVTAKKARAAATPPTTP